MRRLDIMNHMICLSLTIIFIGCKSQQSNTSSQLLPFIQLSATESINENEQTDANRPDDSHEPERLRFSIKNIVVERDLETIFKKSPVFSSHFTGFSLFDISKNEFIANYNAEMYFTPASNVKVLTLYAVLRSFDKKMPAALYRETIDTLFIRPIGDPTLLHSNFKYQPLLEKMMGTKKAIAIEWPEDPLNSFGIGWMWDDYAYSFQPELSWMPIYGNVVKFKYIDNKIKSTPDLFNDLVEISKGNGKSNSVVRSIEFNYFKANIPYPKTSFERTVPFKSSRSLTLKLLKDTLQKSVTIVNKRNVRMDTLFTMPIDTVLRRMMQGSDNFLSEQLLIMAAWKNGFNDAQAFREYMAAEWLQGLEPIWMDGSGLSRYNLIRPMDKVLLLNKLYDEYGWSRIHNLFAQGGISGTLKDWYPNRSNPSHPEYPSEPYIIAKTGTLSNNHNLCGYMQTKSGKLLSFSFMNNNFVRPVSEVKKEMQIVLESIRDSY